MALNGTQEVLSYFIIFVSCSRCSSLHRIHSESEVIQQSGQLLQSYLTDLLNTITRSAKMCPPVIRATFQLLFKRVGERFPEEKNQVSWAAFF